MVKHLLALFLVAIVAALALASPASANVTQFMYEDVVYDCNPWEWHEPNPWVCQGANCTNPETHRFYPHTPWMGFPCWPKLTLYGGATVDFMTTCDSTTPGCPNGVWGWRSCKDGNGNIIQKGYLSNPGAYYSDMDISWNANCIAPNKIEWRHDPTVEWP